MAVLSDYTSGTITLANGSTAVTGTGTLFDVAKFREGDTLQIENLTAVIASVDSNTQLTLTAPWTGADLTNAPYRARYLPDGARVTAQATTLIELLGNGVLSNLAELGVEDGKVPVGNAAGEYELQDYLDDPNGSLGKLAELVLAANKILNTNASGNLIQSDIAAWAISMLGLAGAANKFPYLNAANTAALADITALGRALLALNGANGNIPVITGAGTVASRPIVGPVSQSGGIPTGAIVEVGGSASAGYVRFAGGLQVCWADTSNIATTNTAVGSMFRSDTVAMGNMPVVFTAVPIVFAGGTGGAGGGWTAMEIYPTQNNWGSFSVRSATNIGTNARYFLFAIGKWHA